MSADTKASQAAPQRAGAPQTGASQIGAADAERGPRKTQVGRVVSNKMKQTIVVEIERLVRHARYNKFLRRRTKLYAHDQNSEARVGDTVEVMYTRPISKLKRWRLIRVVTRAQAV